jgi:hypothetical protein
VVPDDGASVIALDAYDGRRVATFELPATHHFASSALVLSRDRIAIARGVRRPRGRPRPASTDASSSCA